MKLTKRIVIYVLTFAAGAAAAVLFLHYNQGKHHYSIMHEAHHGMKSASQHHNSRHHIHDETKMPGLQGKDTTEQEVSDLRQIFRSHKGIRRDVSNISNGIITTTEAEDETLREAIISHVSMMVTRLQEGKNPEVIIQSPTLDELFEVYDEIDTIQ